jgi:Na+(H+)/acetate symporter ActP
VSTPLAITAIVLVLVATVVIGFYGLRISRTTDDLLVASRTVRPWMNASAISGEYLSAATFLGLAGLVLLTGTDAFWFPIGYSAGYLLLLMFVAAPLRRSGARTIPDFIEARLASVGARRVTSLFVLIIGWLYIVPQFHGAAITVNVVTGLPPFVGSVAIAVIVGVIVAAGGMRSITFVQAFHYWLKLTAMGVPVVVLLLNVGTAPAAIDPALIFPLDSGPGGQDLYRTASLMLALLLGTMGLPHVLVRFYTNPDGASARRTTVIVIVMISAFYMLSSTMGLIGRVFAPDLADPATADSVVLLLPSRMLPGLAGDLITALIVAGAFAAFLATSSGLVVSLAGVVSQDILGGSVRAFRISAVACATVPLLVTFLTVPGGLANSVGFVFVVAASSLSPVLLLGVWWRGLTASGAAAGMITGGVAAALSLVVSGFGLVQHPIAVAAFDQPAAWTVPLAIATTVLVSLATRRRVPARADRYLSRLHAPER